MMLERVRLATAAAVAFLLGVPFTPAATAQVTDILFGGLNLAGAIASSSDGS